jgi:predicted phage tail protein
MQRRLCVALLVLTAGCSGGTSGPAAPSRQPQDAGPAGFGIIAPQSAAQCFQFAGDPSCLSGARLRPSNVAAGALVPSAPTALTGSSSGSTVMLTWSAPTGDPATGYVVEAGSAPGLANLANFATGTAATTLTAPNVPAGTYYVRVRASNGSGTGAASNEVVVTVGSAPAGCAAAPGVPSGLTIVSNTGGTVVLSWNPASGSPSTYVVEAGSSSGASDLVSSDLGSAASTLTATGVGAGTYYVRIRARNACGTSGASNEAVVVVAGSTPTSNLSGRWVGVQANGDGATSTPNDCGVERWDWQIDLTQSGSSVTGTLTQVTVSSGCDTPGTVKALALSGTAGAGALSLTSSFSNHVLALSGTFTNSRMTGIGRCDGGACGTVAFALNRQ